MNGKFKWYFVTYKPHVECWNCHEPFDLDKLPKPVRACPKCGHTAQAENQKREDIRNLAESQRVIQDSYLLPLRNENGEVDFNRIAPEGAVTVYTPAKVYPDEGKFRILAENVIKALKEARNKAEGKPRLNQMLVVLRNEEYIEGVRADLLMSIAETASDPVIEFELNYPAMELKLSHGDTKQTLRIRSAEDHQIGTWINSDVTKQRKFELGAYVIFDFYNGSIPEAPKPDKWIEKAVGKATDRPALQRHNYGTFAADSFRIHYQDDLPFIPHPDEPADVVENFIDSMLHILDEARALKDMIHLPPASLLRAVKTASAANKGKVYFDIGKDSLTVWGMSEDGTATNANIEGIVVETTIIGVARRIAFNPKYLKDVLSGLTGDVLTIRFDAKCAHFSDGSTREAVIMQMKVE